MGVDCFGSEDGINGERGMGGYVGRRGGFFSIPLPPKLHSRFSLFKIMWEPRSLNLGRKGFNHLAVLTY